MKKLIALSLLGVFVFGVGCAFADSVSFHYGDGYVFNSYKTKYSKLKKDDSEKKDGDIVYLHYYGDGRQVNLHY